MFERGALILANTQAGNLNMRVSFDSPNETPDGSGGTEEGWALDEYICHARLRYLRGSETVIAARLSGVQPVVVTIRNNRLAQAITPAWRMRATQTGTVYNIRTIVPTDDRQYLELTAVSGVAV